MEKVNIDKKFTLFQDLWSPKIVAELNNQYVKLVKVKGEFVWHHHEMEDELFLITHGTLKIEFRDRTVVLNEGEFLNIPRGVEHKPVADDEVHLILFEPKSTLNTGTQENERTVRELQWI